jgi:hypothetical protein
VSAASGGESFLTGGVPGADHRAVWCSGRSRGATRGEPGLGLVELLLIVVVLAVVGAALYGYFASTTRTVETVQQQKPLSAARLTADRATVAAIRTALQIYYSQHGAYPQGKEAVSALLNPSPAFQCEGNDYRYEPSSGQVTLVIDDPARC